jgi:hypothetical protein
MKVDVQLKFKNFVKRMAKHAVSFRIKNNKTFETGCFEEHEILRNGQFVSRNNKTRFASSFAKQKVKRVSLETEMNTNPAPDTMQAEEKKDKGTEMASRGNTAAMERKPYRESLMRF